MREYSTPLRVELATHGNLTDDVVTNESTDGTRTALLRRGDGAWSPVSASEFAEEVRRTARGLIAAGVKAGDRVAVLSATRYEWAVADYAIWFAGAIGVPLYDSAPAEQVAWIVRDAGVSVAFVENAEQRDRLGLERRVYLFDEGGLDTLAELGREVADTELENRRTGLGPDSVATIIYTSGTTGTPKGCALTHGNLDAELRIALDDLDDLFHGEDPRTLLFLPMAHVLARVVQIGAIRARATLAHAADLRTLFEDLATVQPTFVLAVPRVFEKIFNTASQRAAADGRSRLFNRAAETAMAYSRGLDTGRVRPVVRAQHAAYQRLAYADLRAVFGGRCTYAISGGAPLGERLGHFFRGIGVNVLEGYGLTESSGSLTVNLPSAQRIGTAGRPLQGTAVRVADDGELLFRGPQVFAGYWNGGGSADGSEAAAHPVDADGWLHTGDLGDIDDEGFVRITGRQREILVTAGGKRVAPAILEDRLRRHPLVDQCLVVGDGRPFIAALITLDQENVALWAGARGKNVKDLRRLADDPDVNAAIAAAVEKANRVVSQAEAIREFAVLADRWTEEDGALTPSLKLRRDVLLRRHVDDIEDLYGHR